MADPARYALVKRLLDGALDLPREQREAFLLEACSDASVRDEVRELLAHEDSGPDLVAAGATQHDAASPSATSGWPAEIAGYRIDGLLGQGGMGIVYRATQKHPQRAVALKIVRGFDDSLRRRLELEAELLGRLRHPGIARIYEAGEADGMPFLAMELIEGEPLSDYLRRHRPPREQLLRLVASLCDAVDYAHGRGVIHRDLKPSNIMVTETGPVILDFGVGRVLDGEAQATMLTFAGQIVGTLTYMSPEQASGDPAVVDTRTDVYALGAIAFELLSGEQPRDLGTCTLQEALRIVRDDEPRSLARSRPELAGDIDAMIGTAMALEPARRYRSAADFGDDIRRFLGDEPIAARPVSATYHLRKFARRHRVAVAGALATMVALVVGLIATLMQWRAAENARSGEAQALRVEQQRRSESEAVSAFVQRILRAARPGRLGLDARIVDALAEAEAEIEADFGEVPAKELLIRATMCRTYVDLGMYEDALRCALPGTRIPVGEQDATSTRATLHLNLGLALMNLARYAEGEQHVQRALALFEQSGETAPREMASALSALATSLQQRREFDGARQTFEAAIAVLRPALGESEQLAVLLNNLGDAERLAANYQQAESRLREALAMLERSGNADSPHRGKMLHNLANVLSETGRNEQALEFRRDAVARAS
ncbi:MAG: serine/threonine protein kinase, partial [Planctomycetes bacterium]|nr:serine/threonine protein kinase [Planctomycetota bacterium]